MVLIWTLYYKMVRQNVSLCRSFPQVATYVDFLDVNCSKIAFDLWNAVSMEESSRTNPECKNEQKKTKDLVREWEREKQKRKRNEHEQLERPAFKGEHHSMRLSSHVRPTIQLA